MRSALSVCFVVAHFMFALMAVPVAANNDSILIQVESAGWDDGNFTKFFVDGKRVEMESGRGLNLVILNSENGSVLERHVYDTGFLAGDSEPFASLVESLPTGALVLVGVMDDASENMTDSAREALQELGAAQVNNLSYRSSYVLIGLKGSPALAEKVSAAGSGPVVLQLVWTPPVSNSTTTSSAGAGISTPQATTSSTEASASSTEAPEAPITSTQPQASTTTEGATSSTQDLTNMNTSTTAGEVVSNETSNSTEQLSACAGLRSKARLVLLALTGMMLAHCKTGFCL